jgi:class 3 adenylate cyclase
MPLADKSSMPAPLLVISLERTLWPGLRADLDETLKRMDLAHLSSPTMLILHDLIDYSLRALHRAVFLQLAEADFGMMFEGNEEQLEALYKAEVSEHGSQNIAQYCKQIGWHLAITFPREAGSIVSIAVPVECDITKSNSVKLVEALGYQLDISALPESNNGSLVTLKISAAQHSTVRKAELLKESASLNSVQQIYQKLNYGVMQFSSAGEVIAISPSMLTSMKLEVSDTAIASLVAAIPFNFYNDIIWGLVLTGPSGVFENYRIRLVLAGDESSSILFNVSGYRDAQSIVHSLWQIVSFTGAGTSLGEGSILNEARVSKITRNYVPQLVEEKAREAVRLGKDSLTNEERAVAVLFCDIVGFTSYVESNASSESIINTLNTILRRVSSSVKRFDGSIDKFMGDSVMAIFTDPANAIYAALDMQSHSADINNLRSRAGQDTLRLRIGIHWGDVVIGNVGTAERLDWTAIGDVVNTASRIEKNCKPGSILISQDMRNVIFPLQHPGIEFGEAFTIMVKGKSEALPVCHIKHTDEKA